MAVSLAGEFYPSTLLSLLFSQELLRPIFPKPEDYGDLFLDIADAYMENSEISIDVLI